MLYNNSNKIFYYFSLRKGIQFNSTYFNFQFLKHTINLFIRLVQLFGTAVFAG